MSSTPTPAPDGQRIPQDDGTDLLLSSPERPAVRVVAIVEADRAGGLVIDRVSVLPAPDSDGVVLSVTLGEGRDQPTYLTRDLVGDALSDADAAEPWTADAIVTLTLPRAAWRHLAALALAEVDR